MSGEFTTLGIIFMVAAWTIVISVMSYSTMKVLNKNKFGDE